MTTQTTIMKHFGFSTFSDTVGNHWGPEQDYNTYEENGASVSILISAESGASEIDLSDVVTITGPLVKIYILDTAMLRGDGASFLGHRKTFHRHLKRREGR